MGMFDTINIYMKCPYCGMRGMISFQTKDLGCELKEFEVLKENQVPLLLGENIPDKLREQWFRQKIERGKTKVPEEYVSKLKYVDVIGDCHSVSCRFDADRDSIMRGGYSAGFGRFLEGKIAIVKGHLVGPLYDIHLDGHDEKYFASYKDSLVVNAILQRQLRLKENKGQEVLAVRNWPRLSRE